MTASRRLPVLLLALLASLFITDIASAMYAPGSGRFMQRDPLGYPDGMNSYAAYHVLHGGVDPSGLTNYGRPSTQAIANGNVAPIGAAAIGPSLRKPARQLAADFADGAVGAGEYIAGTGDHGSLVETVASGEYGADLGDGYNQASDRIHTGLDLAGMVPLIGNIADGMNVVIYLAEGDCGNAAISGIAFVPVVGQAATSGRILVKYGDEVVDVTSDVMKHADEARDLARAPVSGGTSTPATLTVDGKAVRYDVDSLHHYTDASGRRGIVESGELQPSLRANNPNDVRYGNGQYLSDIAPGTRTPSQLSRDFLGQPFQGCRFTDYVTINTTGLRVIEGRPGVFVVPNNSALDLAGRIIGEGSVLKP